MNDGNFSFQASRRRRELKHTVEKLKKKDQEQIGTQIHRHLIFFTIINILMSLKVYLFMLKMVK